MSKTLILYRNYGEYGKDEELFRYNDVGIATMLKHLNNINFDKYSNIIGVNLGLMIDLKVKDICNEKNIEYANLKGEELEKVYERKRIDRERRKKLRK